MQEVRRLEDQWLQRPSLPPGLRDGSAVACVKVPRLSIDCEPPDDTHRSFQGLSFPHFRLPLGFEHPNQIRILLPLDFYFPRPTSI